MILKNGFKDSTSNYLTQNEYTGVWISDVPLDENEGAVGDALLLVEIATHLVKGYEWIEEGKPYREFLVPAIVLNRHGIITQCSERDEEEFELERWPRNPGRD